MQSLMARTAMGVAAATASVVLPAWKRCYEGSAQQFDRRLNVLFVASRLLLFVLVFGLLHVDVRGDVRMYFDEANLFLHGGVTYESVDSVYAPLHTGMDAAAIALWRSALPLILLAIVFECVAFPLWLRVARGLWPQNDRMVRIASILYFASPLSLQFVAIDGQNNVMIEMFFALALLAAMRYRETLSGWWTGLSISVVKFLPLIYAPIFLLALKRRWRYTIGGLLGTVPIYLGFWLTHHDITLPFREQGTLKTAGGLPYWFEVVANVDWSAHFWNILLLLPVIAICLWSGIAVARQLRRRAGLSSEAEQTMRVQIIFFGLSAMTLALVCFAQKTWPTYTVMALFPTCMVAAAQVVRFGWKARVLFALYGLVCVLEHSYYSTMLDHAMAPQERHLLGLVSPAAWGFVPLEGLLIAGYLWLMGLSLLYMERPPVEMQEKIPA
jgi:hypothetical protein